MASVKEVESAVKSVQGPRSFSLQMGPDELIIDREKIPLLDQQKDRICDQFHVQVDYDMAMQMESGGTDWKQWVTITGEYEDRRIAKDYIKALCNPQETVPLKYPEELHAILTSAPVHKRLEIQSHTVILFQGVGEAVIQGSDTLSVTLAMSAVEDLIAKYENQESGDETSPIKSSPMSRMASARLDQALKRLSSQDEGFVCDEDFSSMPAAVKRSILGWFMEDSHAESDADTVSQKATKTFDLNHVADQLQQGVNISPKPKSQASSKDVSNSVMPGSSESTIQIKHSGGNENVKHDLYGFALKEGYSPEEIQEVLKSHGSELKSSEFVRALFTNRRAKKLKQSSSSAKDHKDNNVAVTICNSSRSAEQSAVTTPPRAKGDQASGDSDSMLHPLEHMLEAQGSPHLKQKRDGSPSANKVDKKQQKTYAEYMEKLAIHFSEEDGCESIDDYKKKNLERQRILRDHFDRQKVEEVELHTRDEHKGEDSPLRKKQKGKRNRKKSYKSSSSPQVSDQDQAERSDNELADQAVGGSTLRATASAGAGMEKLDDFSLPNTVRSREEGLPTASNANNHSHFQQHDDRLQMDRSRSPHSRIRPLMDSRINFGQQSSSPDRTTHHTDQNNSTQNTQPSQFPRSRLFQRATQQDARHEPQPHVPGVQPLRPGPLVSQQTQLRYIVIDGSNVAMTHGNGEFSCRGIQICIDFFRRRGHTQVTAFVPQWRTREPRYDQPIHDQHLLEELKKQGFLVFTPARRVPGKNIVCYDDRFVLRLAAETDGIMVSNDNYRDLWRENREWRKLIEERLLMYSFVGDIFMPPDDPLGRDGPALDEFLTKLDPMIEYPIRRFDNGGEQQFQNHGRGMQGQGYRSRPPNPGQNQAPAQAQGQGYWARNAGRGQGRSDSHQPRFSGPGRGGYHGRGSGPTHGGHGGGGRGASSSATGGTGTRTNQPPIREPTATQWLHQQLLVVFPDNEETVIRILQNHPAETDLNKLSAFMLEVMT